MKKISASYFIRHVELGDLLETFLVTAVFSILLLRAGLFVFGYPQVGSESLHIAHVLWGGLLMMIGLVLAIAFLNKEARYMAAIFGGAGFGVFIDELGKFITHDNNYFYQPTFALIYIIFVSLYYLFRMLEQIAVMTSQEYAVNAMEMIKEAVVHDLDADEQQLALDMLRRADQGDLLIKRLKRMIKNLEPLPSKKPSWWKQTALIVQGVYANWIVNRYFRSVVIVYFIVMALVGMLVSVLMAQGSGFWIWGLRLSAILVSVLVVAGTYRFYLHSRLSGYFLYRQAVLLTLLLVQFFLFYYHPLLAVGGLIISLVTLVVLHYAMNRELAMVSNQRESNPYRMWRWLLKRFIER